MQTIKLISCCICIALLLAISNSPAFAYIYITYDTVYTGQSKDETAPWLTALFENPTEDLAAGDFDFSEGVLLTLEASNLQSGEFVTNWFFSFNPDKDVESLEFTYVSGVHTLGEDTDAWTQDGGAKGAGKGVPLEIKIPFPKNKNLFEAGSFSQFWITGIDGLVAEDFHFPIDFKGEEWTSVAHIQGVGPGNNNSSWVKGEDPPFPSIPEPSTWLLLGLGLGLLHFARNIKR